MSSLAGISLDMTPHVLIRLAGAAAIAGGALRVASALPLPLDPTALEWLYTIIDVLLLFGLIGIYLRRAAALGFLGLAAFALAVAALSFIGGPDADPFGFSTYAEGAAVLVVALIGLSLAWLRSGERPILAPLLWIGCAVAGGVMTLIPGAGGYGFMAAGVLFGAGFIAAGWSLVAPSATSAAGR